MAENTKIEWCDHTWNVWRGCEKVHTGCKHCYAETLARRNEKQFGKWGPDGTRVKAAKGTWDKPLKWQRQAAKTGERVSCFPSLMDPFEDRPDLVPLRDRMFGVIDQCPMVDFLLLTKRPENVRRMWPTLLRCHQCHGDNVRPREVDSVRETHCQDCGSIDSFDFRPNVLIGTSISDQETADKFVPELLKLRDLTPCLFLSVEPLVGPVDLSAFLKGKSCVAEECGGASVPSCFGWGTGDRRERERMASCRTEGKPMARRDETHSMQSKEGGEELRKVPASARDDSLEAGQRAGASLGLETLQRANSGRPDDQPCGREHVQQPPGQFGIGDACTTDGASDSSDRSRPSSQSGAVSWVIVGGESGPKARPCGVHWIRLLVRDCTSANVPVFVKQLGADPFGNWGQEAPCPGGSLKHDGVHWHLRHPKGGDPDEWPRDLCVRQFPTLERAVAS